MTSSKATIHRFDLFKEGWETPYENVWDDVYTINEPIIPGGVVAASSINNRAFVFQVETKELGQHFLISGLPSHNSIRKIKQLEHDTNIRLKVVVASGDFHHMTIKFWLEAFPVAFFIHSSLKFPTTRNGMEILNNDKWKKRIALVDSDAFPSLKVYKATVQFFGFNQCLTVPDKPFMSPEILLPSYQRSSI